MMIKKLKPFSHKHLIVKITIGAVISVLVSCGNQKLPQDPIPNHDTFDIVSEHVGETRKINVWAPHSYENTSESYPVLYMLDGGVKEDFPHVAGTIEKLVRAKSIPPIILVGIENTKRGRDLTGFSDIDEDSIYCPLTDGSSAFRAFITEELIAEIDQKYRTNNQNGIIGESLAGLFVVETLLQNPTSFDYYMAMDPSLWWNDHYLVRHADSLIKNLPDNNLRLWFAGSNAKDISQYTNALSKSLTDHSPSTLKWKYSDEPKEKHNTVFRATKEKALQWMLNQ